MAQTGSIISGMASRYAGSLFDLASEAGTLDEVEKELARVETMLADSADLRRLVTSPVFSGEDQLRAISAIADRAGLKDLVGNFLRVVARNRRLFALPGMIAGFRKLAAEARGEVSAEVISAHALTAQQETELKQTLKGVAGRLELAGVTPAGSPVLIDYAHTPDGLDKLLRAARPHTAGKVVVVFGAGGDRDPTKREKMGAVAQALADRVIVTDDNPRSEEPATIRAAILKGAPGAIEIGDREQAIRTAIEGLEAGDTLLVAGKGHETGQTIKGVVHPFDDGEVVRRVISEMKTASAGKGGGR